MRLSSSLLHNEFLYYDNLYNHRIYCETVHYKRCLTPADLKLNLYECQCALNRIDGFTKTILSKQNCQTFLLYGL